ncbi:Uncharacterised protein g10947 [Pycnogonum litorale]
MSNEYKWIKNIGKGTFGEVWLVIPKLSNGKKLVAKVIDLHGFGHQDKLKSLNEVKILSKLKHVNVIKYKDAFIASNQAGNPALNIIMEYADGGDLGSKIKQQNGILFPETVILNYFVQISFALMYIHNQNVLHRDLKPQNIFLTNRDIIKVGDFGIARTLAGSKDLATTAIGTPYYIPPEICRREPYGFSSDIWALGCITYELATLRKPFVALNIQQLILKIMEAIYSPLPKCYGPLLHDMVSFLLKLNPRERPSSRQILGVPSLQPYVNKYVKQYQQTVFRRSRRSLESNDKSILCSPLKQMMRKERSSSLPTVCKSPGEKMKRIREDFPSDKNVKTRQLSLTYLIGSRDHKYRKFDRPLRKSESEVNPSSSAPRDDEVDEVFSRDDAKERGKWLSCDRCSLQTLWDSRTIGTGRSNLTSLKQGLVLNLGQTKFELALEFLTNIWEQQHSTPVQELLKIVGESNMNCVPLLFRLVAQRMKQTR